MASMEMEHKQIPDWGIDLPNTRRPGVPREASPRPYPGAHWIAPERQIPHETILKRVDLPELTPAFGTVAPPRGLSGQIRRLAYRFADHLTRHWALLLAADGVEALESRFSPRRSPASKGLIARTRALLDGARGAQRQPSQA